MQQILAAEAKRLNSEHNIDKKSIISTQQVEEFLERGVVVIRNVLNSDEILKARKGFHEYLREQGVDPDNLRETAFRLSELSSTGGSGGVIDVFYQ